MQVLGLVLDLVLIKIYIQYTTLVKLSFRCRISKELKKYPWREEVHVRKINTMPNIILIILVLYKTFIVIMWRLVRQGEYEGYQNQNQNGGTAMLMEETDDCIRVGAIKVSKSDADLKPGAASNLIRLAQNSSWVSVDSTRLMTQVSPGVHSRQLQFSVESTSSTRSRLSSYFLKTLLNPFCNAMAQ